MTSLRGRAHIKIDPKGRLSLPTAFRSSLGKTKSAVITNGVFQGRRFLDFYPSAEWLKLEKKIAAMPALKSEVQVFQRFYLSSGEACDVDAQGRVLVPQHLREYAGLEDDIVLVGMGNKIEIWGANDWQDLFGRLEKDFEAAAEVLAGLEISRGHKK